jgi:glycosyltransferase involved in cell wall biosynthesis
MSNLRPTKRIDLLLRVIAAAKQRQNIRLLILAGDRFEPYEPLLDQLNLRQNVVVRTAAEPVENYINAADAGLSTSEVESFGLSILEMMFFGKPVLAFAIGGVPEVVGDGSSLHDFGDITSMAVTLDELVASPDTAKKLGVRGEARAKSQFTAAKIVPMYEQIYRRVLDAEHSTTT